MTQTGTALQSWVYNVCGQRMGVPNPFAGYFENGFIVLIGEADVPQQLPVGCVQHYVRRYDLKPDPTDSTLLTGDGSWLFYDTPDGCSGGRRGTQLKVNAFARSNSLCYDTVGC